MDKRHWITILLAGLMGLLMLGGIWLLTRSAGTVHLSLPSGELKSLTTWTNELIVQNDEMLKK